MQGSFKKFENGRLIEEGDYKNGLIDGKLKEFDKNGNITSLMDFKAGVEVESIAVNRTVGGKKNGLWQQFDKEGNLIQQEVYVNGILVTNDGTNETAFKIEKEYFPNGQLKSQFMKKNGFKNGIQTNFDSLGNPLAAFSFQNDTLLAKGWFNRDGTKDSTWEHYTVNGKIAYQGSYKDGKKDGLWIYYFDDGTVEQKGRYQENLPHGEWFWYYPNSQVRRQENFYKGKYEGVVKDFDESGNLIQDRNFVYNTQEGNSYYFIGDHQEKGEMQNGLREGKWTYYYNGKKKAFVGKFKDGLPDGKHKYWFGNGRRSYLMKYKKGRFHGKFIEYIETGGVNHVYIYKNGKLKTLDGEEILEKAVKK